MHQELLINDQTTPLGQWTNRDSFWCLRGHKQNIPIKNRIDLKLTFRKMSKK